MPQPSNLNNSSQGIIKLVPIYVGPSIIKVQVVATEAISNLASLQFGVDTKRTDGNTIGKIGDLIEVVSGTKVVSGTTSLTLFSNIAFSKTTGVLGQSGFGVGSPLYGSATVSLIDSTAKSALPNDVLATLTFSRINVANPANERLELALFDVIQITGTVDDPTDSGTGVTGLSDGGGAFFAVPNSLKSQVIPENWLSVRVVDGNTLLANGDVASNSKLINSNVVMIDVDQMNGDSLVGSGVMDYPAVSVSGRTRISVLEDDIGNSPITTKIRFEMPNNGNSDQGILVDLDNDGVGADNGNVDRVLTFTLDDALAALKISTGNLNLTRQQVATPYQIVAADFNGDGFVTAADALGILKTHLGHASTLQPGFTLIDIDAAGLTTANAAQSTAIGYGSDPFETEISLTPTELNYYSQIADGLINSHLDVALVLRGNVVNPVSWANISNPTTEVQSFSPTPATTITLSGNGTQVSTSVQNFSAIDKMIIVSGWGVQTDNQAPQFVNKLVSNIWFESSSIYDQDATYTSIFSAPSSLNPLLDTIIRLQYADFGTVLALYDASVLTNAAGRPADGIADAYIELPGYFGNIYADITTTGLVISSAFPYGGVAVANLPSWVPPPGS